jgi:hypothetical protein
MIERCPTCCQPVPAGPTRVCFDCKKPMSNRDKWTYQTRSGVMTMVYGHCDAPTSYTRGTDDDDVSLKPSL